MTTFDFEDGNGPVPAHQHVIGGGWVADTATVEDSAYVGPNARVFGNAFGCNGDMIMVQVVERKFYSDPGHGWVAVKLKELYELGIMNEISSYSYYKGKTAYLEEDRDYGVYAHALARQGKTLMPKVKNSDKSSPIRSYNRYPINMIDVYKETINA